LKTFYAYVHARPDFASAHDIFYVGKGSGNRSAQLTQRNFHHANTIKKHGPQNIRIGQMPCSSESTALSLEIGLIKTLRRMGVKLCNFTDGGEGVSGHKHTAESRALMSAQRVGRKASDATKKKMRDSQRGKQGKPHTPESKAKIAAAKIGKAGPWLGKTRSVLTNDKISAALMGRPGRPHTQEAKDKIAAGHLGKKMPPVSAQTREKLSIAIKAAWALRLRKVKEN
jgi:hypothetical protein